MTPVRPRLAQRESLLLPLPARLSTPHAFHPQTRGPRGAYAPLLVPRPCHVGLGLRPGVTSWSFVGLVVDAPHVRPTAARGQPFLKMERALPAKAPAAQSDSGLAAFEALHEDLLAMRAENGESRRVADVPLHRLLDPVDERVQARQKGMLRHLLYRPSDP